MDIIISDEEFILNELYEKLENLLIEEQIHWEFEEDNMFAEYTIYL